MVSTHAQCRLTGLFWGQTTIYVTNMQASWPTNINNVDKEIVNSTTNRGSQNEPALIPRKSYSLKYAPGTLDLLHFQPSVLGKERTRESGANRA